MIWERGSRERLGGVAGGDYRDVICERRIKVRFFSNLFKSIFKPLGCNYSMVILLMYLYTDNYSFFYWLELEGNLDLHFVF